MDTVVTNLDKVDHNASRLPGLVLTHQTGGDLDGLPSLVQTQSCTVQGNVSMRWTYERLIISSVEEPDLVRDGLFSRSWSRNLWGASAPRIKTKKVYKNLKYSNANLKGSN